MKTITRCVLFYLAVSSNVHAIVLGSVDATNKYSSVGYTLTTAGGLGSVVALDSNWVLTAAHVVESAPGLMVMGDAVAGTEGVYFFFDQVITHPNYMPGEFHDDLALIRLSDSDPIKPQPGVIDVSFATLSNVALTGSLPLTATITGYGLTSIDGDVDPNAPLVRRYGEAATDPFGPAYPGFDPGFPFDCSLTMYLCTWSTTGGAPGDSGGAMCLDYGGGDSVAGINSFIFDESDLQDPPGAPNWDDGYWTVATSTAYYEDWITGYVHNAMFGSA
ncbi:MAG: S1 family peptidase, partial [Gammaproteobacteria bacterium]